MEEGPGSLRFWETQRRNYMLYKMRETTVKEGAAAVLDTIEKKSEEKGGNKRRGSQW